MTKNTIYREFRNINSKLLESEGDLVGHYGDAGSAALHEAREGHAAGEAVGVRDGEQPCGHGAAVPKDKEIVALKAQMQRDAANRSLLSPIATRAWMHA